MNIWGPECCYSLCAMNALRYWQRRTWMVCDVCNWGMTPVGMLRPVRIHHVFLIPSHSLSFLCVACIIMQCIHILPCISCLCKLKARGWTSLFNSKFKNCSTTALRISLLLWYWFSNSQPKNKEDLNFKGLSQDERRINFSKGTRPRDKVNLFFDDSEQF